jgi:hypothetical protein
MEIVSQGPIGLATSATFTLVTDKDRLELQGFDYQAHATIMQNKVSVAKYDRLYELEEIYFFMDKQNQFHQASKLALLKLMPRHRKEIVAFMTENQTSFKNVEHLTNLVNFCNQLLLD